MKALSLLAVLLLFVFCLSLTTGITSCTKTETVYDTTIITIHDTLMIKDSANDLTTGLVAYYTFNNGSLADSSGHENNIVLNNATKTTDRSGRANNAYLFDGSSSYMQVKNSSSLNPDKITLYAIVKVNGYYAGTCNGNQILAKGDRDDVNGFYNLRFNDFSVSCGIANYNNETFGGAYGDNNPKGLASGALSSTPIETGKWYKVVFTYNGMVSKIYVNGELVSAVQKKANFAPNMNDLFIGKLNSSSYPYFFNGVIDEIRIYNRELPECAIKNLVKLEN